MFIGVSPHCFTHLFVMSCYLRQEHADNPNDNADQHHNFTLPSSFILSICFPYIVMQYAVQIRSGIIFQVNTIRVAEHVSLRLPCSKISICAYLLSAIFRIEKKGATASATAKRATSCHRTSSRRHRRDPAQYTYDCSAPDRQHRNTGRHHLTGRTS